MNEEDFFEKNITEKILEKEDSLKKSFIGHKIHQNKNLESFLNSLLSNSENLQYCNNEYKHYQSCLQKNNLLKQEKENSIKIKKNCSNEINLIYNCFKQNGKLI